MPSVKTLPAALMLCVAFAAATLAQERAKPVDVSGTVTGADGAPRKFARVQLEGPRRYVAITNSEGAFVIRGVLAGRYRVTITEGENVQRYAAGFAIGPDARALTLAVRW